MSDLNLACLQIAFGPSNRLVNFSLPPKEYDPPHHQLEGVGGISASVESQAEALTLATGLRTDFVRKQMQPWTH